MEMTIELLEQFYTSSTENMKINFKMKVELAESLKQKKTCKRDIYKLIADEEGCVTWRTIENIANSQHFKNNFMQKETPTD